ncbi:MAG: hypothetical protein JWM18_2149 [Chloroflexi bacterium]|nr:hypothetical protein [Chloroflexota bacterium]
MRRDLVVAGMAAVLVLVAGCGGAPPLPVAIPAPTAVPTPAPTAEPAPTATAEPVPMAVSQLVPPAPSPSPTLTPVVRALAPAPRPARRPTTAPTPASQPPVIISRGSPPAQAQPARVVSDNWSGYVAQGGGLWQVSGSWTEPSVRCTAPTAESVFWVGLGGYPGYPLYQAGSGAFCRNGVPIHVLWYELLTPGSTAPLTALVQINPGDLVSAAITLRSGAGGGQVHLADGTTGYTRDVAFTPVADSLGSAEWIVEATSHGGTVSTLADFASVSFAGCSANLGAAGVAASPAAQLTELSLSDRSGGRAEPGAVRTSAGGGGFSVSYLGA